MSYTHLTMFERSQLEIYRGLGWSLRQIAAAIHRHPSTIGREIQRNQTRDQAAYCSQTSHIAYRQRRLTCRPRGKWNPEIQQMIEAKLQLTWSPEQIAGRLFSDRLSTKTIYNWLYHGFLENVTLRVLRQKGKRQRPKETRGRFNVGTSIRQRPKEVRSRNTFGHWELDTVVSGRGDSKGCFGTFVERKTRFYMAVKMRNRTAEAMEAAIRSQWDRYKEGTFRTATVDRGKEFSCYKILEQTIALPFYFADPYSSWQRGSNENANGLLREFFPKATNLALISEASLEEALALINHRPRKCLNWQTAHEAFEQELSHLD